MPRPIAKRYVDRARALLAKEGHTDDERVQQLAIMLRDAKALDKPAIAQQGVFIVVYKEDELGEVDANVHYEFYDGKGNAGTPSAELAAWILSMAMETLEQALPHEDWLGEDEGFGGSDDEYSR